MPPPGASYAARILSKDFPAIMATVGTEIEVLGPGERAGELDAALYGWRPAEHRPFARRHVELFVDDDLPPTPGVERVYPSAAWRNWMWGRYHGAQLGEHFGTVIPNWVDPELWPLCHEPDLSPGYFLFVGRLWPNKAGMLPHLIRTFPEERFLVAGEGDRSFLEAPNVTFLGQVEQGALAAVMGSAIAVLCPTVYCEPFGLAAVEAELTGALVIASDLGGFHENVSPSSFHVDPYSLTEWAGCIRIARMWANQLRSARRTWHKARHAPQVIASKYLRLLEAVREPARIEGARGAMEAVLKPFV